jgi:hypothetical protein
MHSSTSFLFLGALLLLASVSAGSAQDCESGQQTSAAGTVVESSPDDLADGWYLYVDVAIRSCDFEALWLEQEPGKECAAGASFVANGTIRRGFEVTLDVESIVCTPK